jgi:hypothetical protein
MVGLLLITAWIYAPALKFGFIWDDPLWYSRVVGKSLKELVSPMADYHMYRPALVLYNRLFLNPDNTFAAPMLHAAQVGWHLLNICMLYALCRRLGLEGWAAVAASVLFAWYAFSHQATAWSAPAQPLAGTLQLGSCLAYVGARRKRRGSLLAAGLSTLLFLLALAVQENSAALCALPLLIEWVLRRPQSASHLPGSPVRRKIPWLALTYPLIAAGFGTLWLLTPRQSGFVTPAFEVPVQLYIAQGFVFPLLGRPAGYAPGHTLTPATILIMLGLALLWLLAAAWRAGRMRQAVLALAWGLLGVIVPATQLRYSYVSIASRLLYHASPGIALLWACALLPPINGSRTRYLWRTGGAIALGLIALQSLLLVNTFQRLYAAGATHIAALVQAAEAEDTRLLCVNFPDRYAPKRPPYPWGKWWMTLAPGSVDLASFPTSITGVSPDILSRRMPWIDGESRDASPYLVDLRGEMVTAVELYQLARQMDAVYLSRYYADGTFELQWAGAVVNARSLGCRLAVFGQTLCLQEAHVEQQPNRLSVTLTWRSLSPTQPHDTIFVHLGQSDQPPIAQADGDFWLGMLPLTTLAPGDTIQEQRIIPLPEGASPGQLDIRIGVYNRLTGKRLPATTPQGDPLADDATVIGYLP